MDAKKFGLFIASCRKEKDMTQVQLGELLHVSDKTVSRWESGRGFPEITILPALAETLNISLSELLECEKENLTVNSEKNSVIIQTLEIASEQIRQAKVKCCIAMVLAIILELLGIFISCYYVDDLQIRSMFIFVLGWTGISISSLLGTLFRKK